MTRPSPGPSTPPPPPGPKTPARQDFSQAAVGLDGPATFSLPKPPEFLEFCSGSAMYVGGRWST
jgi:hypothetical protein